LSEERTGWFSLFREALSDSEQDFTKGDLRRAVVLLAIPMVLEMLMESIFAVCDVFFVARLGPDAVATVGLTETVMTLIYALAFGLAMSTTAVVARRWGEGDKDGAARSGVQALMLAVTIGVSLGIPAMIFAPELLGLMRAEPGVIENGVGYTRVLLGTNAIVLMLFLGNAIFRGAGDAAGAMRALWIANGINLVLDPCLIFGLGPFPELGVTGAAVATSIGRGVGVLYQVSRMLRGPRIRVGLEHLGFRPAMMAKLVRVSMGGIGQQLVAMASWIFLMRIVAGFGSTAVAGYTIAIRVLIFAILPSWGLANAAATLVGQSLGAKDPDRAERAVWLTGGYNMAFLGAVSIVMITLPGPIISIFDPDNAPVVAIGESALRIISYGYVFYAWEMVMVQAFNGAGDTMTPTKINVFCFWLCQIGMAWVLAYPMAMGPDGVFIAVAVSYSLAAVIAVVLFRRGRWKHASV
jgi:putative MATE family efflux protein